MSFSLLISALKSSAKIRTLPFTSSEALCKFRFGCCFFMILEFCFSMYEDQSKEQVTKDNVLLRACELRNTDFVDGIVLYAGKPLAWIFFISRPF